MSKEETKQLLIIGIGNSGRSDDGIGWKLLDGLDHIIPSVCIVYRYQLHVEDAELISHFNKVIFVDATKEKVNHGFFFRKCIPENKCSFSSHALDPETVLWLEKELYHNAPKAYVLGVSGVEWKLSQGLSHTGNSNMLDARKFLIGNLLSNLEKNQDFCLKE